MKKPRVLWVEDSARFELASFLGPIYASRKYELDLAEDATSAVRYLQTVKFDAIIMDIRLPPGQDRHWRDLYGRAGSDKSIAQLGLQLLLWLLHPNYVNGNGLQRPMPVRPRQIGVFSVESEFEIGRQLAELGISVFIEKRPGLRDTILLEVIDKVLAQIQTRQGGG
jgi:CheY-like chemotaxis protein